MVQYRDTPLNLPLEAPTPPLSRTSPWQGTHPLLWFAQRYPLVFWSSLFSSMMLLTALATTLLVNPLRADQERSRVTPIVSPVVMHQSSPASPLWALGAITASCAVVSLLLTTSLGGATQRRRLIKHSIPAPHAEPRHRVQLDLAPPAPNPATATAARSNAANLDPIATPFSPEGAPKNAVLPAVEPKNRATPQKSAYQARTYL